ncbi:MAG: DNA topoisomerase I [Methanomassiliicoccales archaeon]|nr:DNA topoisomerase I [Methanomassiliicoccales archaeon]
MKNLVISEKNSVALRLAIVLSDGKFKRERASNMPVYRFSAKGDEFTIIGLRGHIVELDYPPELNDWRNTDPRKLIYATPYKRVLYSKMVSTVIEEAAKADWIVVATDFDREGELIGIEAIDLVAEGVSRNNGRDDGSALKLKVRRARFSSLGRGDVIKAFEELHDIDIKLAKSAECRQLVDLAWGATLTRMISMAANQVGKNFLSVGRVQSPTLALIVRREMEIEKFVPKPFFDMLASCFSGMNFQASHESNPFWDREKARLILSGLSSEKTGTVEEFVSERKEEYGPVPFSTTLFIVDATRLGYSGSEAMEIAERLYSGGLISYPRTDNTVYPRSLYLKGILEKLADTEFAPDARKLLEQERIVPTRGRVETTDHPPIYPVEGASRKHLSKREWGIYELVARRFMATVAPRSVVQNIHAKIRIGKETFLADGKKLIEEGWRHYYPYYRFYESDLPELEVGKKIDVRELTLREDKTKPPARYSQGNLIREMEKLALGTKSTRHEIIQKLYDRKYVQGDIIKPTPIGTSVSIALEKRAPEICESKMTARLEEDMDRIAEGKITLDEVVSESRQMLSTVVEEIDANSKEIGEMIKGAILEQKRLGKCKSCEGDLRIIERGVSRFAGCSNYPECTVTFPLPSGYLIKPAESECSVCGLPMIKLITKGNRPVDVCLDPGCESNRMTGRIGKCPKCGRELHVIRSQRGKRFIGCTGYPECNTTYPLPQSGTVTPTGESCPSCGAPVIEMAYRGRGKWRNCANMNCPSKSKKEK